ncbi:MULTISPECIES: response regulator [Desulfovibrio]|jgi:DNA-binding NtrC family response regulator|uniref:response regulator n=1 Tax=Desulfovibrio TaxID=872 RepID=UPI0003FAEC8D|nr:MULTISPECIES: response regulator [Desulfovibrio]MDY0305104.1 response regulator [Desulfovibrionaceae bacterium]HMM38850.1 response regulator [Desulfovibrio sp.]
MEKARVLVVDDEKEFVDLFVNRFNKRNVLALGAGSGQEALKTLQEEPVDVVVLDLKMPGMDGIETLKEIKKRHPLVEVIMLTGHGSVEAGLQGMGHGAYDFIMKPFNIEDLLVRINKARERKALNEKRQE